MRQAVQYIKAATTAAVVLMVGSLLNPLPSASAATRTSANAGLHATLQTEGKVSYRQINAAEAPEEIQTWVQENISEPCTLYKNVGDKTYILVSRGYQAGSRSVQVTALKTANRHTLVVYYREINPRPGRIESHLMAPRFTLVVTNRFDGNIRFVKLNPSVSL
jgi:hypothetical protein